MFLLPPPHLHVILLGPANDAFSNIEERADINQFKKKHNLKGSGPCGDLNGPLIKKIINNEEHLSELEQLIPDEMKLFVDHLRDISFVN